MGKTPEPIWHRLQQDGKIELRAYAPMIVAEVTMTGERYQAINDGFRALAGYIFGGNTVNQKIAMTAPVLQERADKGEKIAMTAPVMQAAAETANEWRVRFVMPASYTLATLPRPNDARVKLIEVPAHKVAVIRFAGLNRDENLQKHRDQLLTWVRAQNLKTVGTPSYAFYNPPWTLPFLRRNEVMVGIAP